MYVLFISTSIWVLHTPNAGQNIILHFLGMKKLKKEEKARKLGQNLANMRFSVCPQMLINGFITRKNKYTNSNKVPKDSKHTIRLQKCKVFQFLLFLGKKPSTIVQVQTQKINFLLNFASISR